MISYSQAGQDRFVREVLGSPKCGSFLDIGANNPIAINNTAALEQTLGWRGLLVDNSVESMQACEEKRKSAFLLTDAAHPQDWLGALRQAEEINHGASLHTPRYIDYLSLDVDEASLACLKNLPLEYVRFRAITLEHDRYRFGEGRRDEMVGVLRKHGYDILCADVCDQGLPFEIWAVDPTMVDMKLAEKFRRNKPTEWREFFHDTI